MKKNKRVKTPTVIQMEAVECGAACLGIILGYYGHFEHLTQLREACGISRNGSKPSYIATAAKQYGLDAEIGLYSADELADLSVPAILFWNHEHYVVLEGIKNNVAYLNDPAVGPRQVTLATLKEKFSELVIEFTLTKAFKKKPRQGTVIGQFWKIIKNIKSPLGLIAITTLLLTVPTLLTAAFSQIFINDYLIDRQSSWINLLLFLMLFITIIQFILVYIQRSVTRRIETEIAISNNSKLINHLLKLPIAFFEQRSAGDLITRLQSNDNIAKLISGPLSLVLISLLQSMIYFIVMLFYSYQLTLAALLIAILNISSYYALKKIRSNLSILYKQQNGRLTGITMNGVGMIETLKASASENNFFTKWQEQLIHYLNTHQRISLIDTAIGALPVLLTILGQATILGLGAWLAINGLLSIGGIVAFQMLFLMFNEPIQLFVDIGSEIQLVEADFKRVADVENTTIVRSKQVNAKTHSIFDKQHFVGGIEIENLTFGYCRLEAPLFENFNMTIQPGSHTIILGPANSGKSSLIKLLAGFYTPWSGEIRIDGVPLQALNPAEKAQLITAVNQQGFFFKGSIQDNLTFWDQDINAKELIAPTKAACIYDVIANSSAGFNHTVLEGASNYSAGQRQRLALARIFMGETPVIMLDNIATALDSLIEEKIKAHLYEKTATCIMVGHCIGTTRDADHIYILDAGKITAQGTHDSLLKEKNTWYEQLLKTDVS